MHSLGLDVPLRKEYTNPRGQEDSRQLATSAQNEAIGPVRSTARTYLGGELNINVYVLSKDNRKSWSGSWCAWENLDTPVKSSDDSEEEEEDCAPVLEVVQAQPPHNNPPQAGSGRETTRTNQGAQGTQLKAKAKPKTSITSTVAMRLTEGWRSMLRRGIGFHTTNRKSRTRSSYQEDVCHHAAETQTSTKSTVRAHGTQ